MATVTSIVSPLTSKPSRHRRYGAALANARSVTKASAAIAVHFADVFRTSTSSIVIVYDREDVKMRIGLLLLFWLCVFSTFIQVPLLCFEIWLLATGTTFSDLSIWALLTEHLPFLTWVANLILVVLGTEFGGVILGLPATLVTSFKLVFGTLIGIWASNALREMDASRATDG